MPVLKHTHTYIRVKTLRDGKFYLYRCADKECTHREDKLFLVGKASRCTSCGNEFQLTAEDLRSAKPRCIECKETKKAKLYKEVKNLVTNLFEETL
jgi:hypothetical protein